jgi:hypothetical protein
MPKLNNTKVTQTNTVPCEKQFSENTHTVFRKKQDAIEHICATGGLKLFSEDLSEENGSKQFMATTYDNMYCLSLTKDKHMYENYEANQAIKLVLDIDFKIKNPVENKDEQIVQVVENKNGNDINNLNTVRKKKDDIVLSGFGDLLIQCISTINDKLKEHTDTDPIIIILTSCRAEKMSAHIIYTNIHFNDISQMKVFIMSTESHLISSKIIDPLVYKVSCMRLLWNSKKGKSNNLTYYNAPFLSNKYTYVDDYTLFMDCLLTRINQNSQLINIEIPVMKRPKNNVPKQDKLKKETKTKGKGKTKDKSKENPKGKTKGKTKDTTKTNKRTKQKKAKDNTIDTDEEHSEEEIEEPLNYNIKYEVEILKQYVDLLSNSRVEDYNEWVKVGMCIYNSNNTNEAFLLWDEWSKKSPDKYSGTDINYWKWNTFDSNGPLTIGTLKYYAKQDNRDTYDTLIHPIVDLPKFNAIKITENYLIEQEANIKDTNSVVCNNIQKWYNTNDIVSFVCLSTYDTGKTTMINKIIYEFPPKRALFITHRQSLTWDLHKVFTKHSFCSYLHDAFNAKRLICQIESLHKIVNADNPNYSYDIVILDEIESLLYHFTSKTIAKKQQTFQLMYRIVQNSKKIIATDGDFHNRGFDFINSFGKSIIIQNEIIKHQRMYIFTEDQVKFNNMINDDLKNNLNVAIVSLSAKKCKIYYKKYMEKYNTKCHTSDSDDAMKEALKDVEAEWLCRLLIISPAVQSGVSFNMDHYDKMYIILSMKSCTSRDLMQMGQRIRKFQSNEIYVYLNKMPYRETANFYTYEQMHDNVLSIYKQQADPRNYSTPAIESLYIKILTHNELETANKDKFYFVPKFIEYIKQKGSNYKYDETGIVRTDDENNDEKADGKDEKNDDTYDFKKEGIIAAEDIDKATYNRYVKLNIQNEATESQKYAIEKYLYKQTWKTDQIDQKFMDLWFRKSHMLMNLKCLVDKKMIKKLEKQTTTIDKYTKETYLVYDAAKQQKRVDCIHQLIEMMGFAIELIGPEFEISYEEFEKNVQKCKEDCSILNGTDDVKFLFGNKKKNNLITIKAFMGVINSILKEFGLSLISLSKTKRLANDEYDKPRYYHIAYYGKIDQYL